MTDAENYAVTSAADAAVKFSKIFYECLDKKRSALSKLYLDSASLIWNGENVAGKAAIAKYLDSLPGTGGTTVDAVDCHPLPDALTAGQTSMVVVVMGTIKFLVKNPKVVPYTETFVLTSEPSTGGAVVWKIAKDSFRLLE